MGLSNFMGSLQDCAFLAGDPDGETESAARRKYVLHNPISLVMLSAGSTLGLKCGSRTAAAPDCAKESKVEAALRPLWPLFF